MTITWYLAIGCLMLFMVCIIGLWQNWLRKRQNQRKRIWSIAALFVVILGCLSPLVLKKYIYPQNPKVFNNADYHILEHSGFNVNTPFFLVNEEEIPIASLYDNKEGLVSLDRTENGEVKIEASNFLEPLFYSTGSGKHQQYNLMNRYYNSDCSEGFTISKNGVEVYRLEIKERGPWWKKKENKYKRDYISYINGDSEGDTSEFTKLIQQGYMLSDIVESTPGIEMTDDLRTILDGVSLVRDVQDDASSDLVLLPGYWLARNGEFAVNGEYALSDRTFSVDLMDSARIYIGFGFRKTRTMSVAKLDSARVKLRYTMPVRKKLRGENSRLVITSSIDVAAENTMDGVYLYNIFSNEDNINNVYGSICYGVGNSREEMRFEVKDMNAVDELKRDIIVGSNEDFCLQTRQSHENNETEWVFRVQNMRDTNGLTYSKIIWWFVALFVILVCLRVISDIVISNQGNGMMSLSGFEIGVYLVILTFGVTRLILSWRSSTFLPLDDIGASAYDKMRGNLFWWTIGCCHMVPLVLMMAAWVTYLSDRGKIDWMRNTWIKIKQWDPVCVLRRKWNKTKPWLKHPILYYVITVACLMSLKYTALSRFAIIFFPLLLYFGFDRLFIKRFRNRYPKGKTWLEKKLCRLGWERPLLLLIATGLFFIGDAGFAVIFLTFSMVRLAVSALTEDNGNSGLFGRLIRFIGMLVVTFLFILYEGEMMILVIDHLSVVLPLAALMIAGLFAAIIIVMNRLYFDNRKSTRRVWRTAVIIVALGLVGAAFTLLPFVKNEVAKKGVHMKYRAEVQQLKAGDDIGDLMRKCDFNSTDIIFIMRSAQNQWFLNSYLKGGEDLDTYFHIQPHSCQGSPYNTQTTDVVVTRYVKAEHKGMIAELMALMLLLLISIYCIEIEVVGKENNNSRLYLSMLLFLFVIAFSVYMSATNRSVFMGQDFPFLSIQSRIAVLLPCVLLLLVSMHVMQIIGERKWYADKGKRHINNANSKKTIQVWLVLSTALWLFAFVGWKIVPSKGVGQENSQFDVSKIINDVSETVDRLDYSFDVFQGQEAERLEGRPLEEVWMEFTESSKEWKSLMKNGTPFIKSLMTVFDSKMAIGKQNPNELVHIRKRQNRYRMCVNRRFYFIEGIIDSHYPWTGNLLAAETPLYFNLSNVNNPRVKRPVVNGKTDFEANIIPSSLRRKVSTVQIMRFDTSWTSDHEPLLLIKTIPNNTQYFDLESDDMVVHGRGVGIQPAMRILPNDQITINNRYGRTSKTVLTWRYGKDNERYLAKNIWINGRQQLFYPLGKESMWSYQFANLVKNVCGDNETYRNRDLRISIDYDLHKEMHRILSEKNKNVVNMSEDVRENLNDLLFENYAIKTASQTQYYIYYNKVDGIFCRSNTAPANRAKEIDRLLIKMNNLLGRYKRTSVDSTVVSDILSNMLQRQFNYSAVVLDGNGRIRLLFDYNKRGQSIDPNNIAHYNKFMSDMYRDGSNEMERDVLGNKTLQLLNPGPGSTFKPIMYTAVTSGKQLAWNTLDVSGEKPQGIVYVPRKKNEIDNKNPKYTWYGGVEAKRAGMKYFSIAGGASLNHNNYIIQSNNLYHSVIVLLGMQNFDEMESIVGPARSGKEGFPKFMYNGTIHSFNPDKWYEGRQNNIDLGYSVMEEQLRYNFHLNMDYNTKVEKYTNFYGNDSIFRLLFEQKKYPKQWCYAETGSLNRFLRQRSSWLSDGFVQMVSGSSPLEVTPLQVAIMGMRLASLNSAEHISTLNDAASSVAEMANFDVNESRDGGWKNAETYFEFYKTQVLGQMRKVPVEGTASALRGLSDNLRKQGYYLYVKTGTLNIEENKTKRIRNMLVIISNKPLEAASNLSELRKIRYYVIYMSYRNVDKSGFSNDQFRSQIEAVVNSDLFNQYMKEGL